MTSTTRSSAPARSARRSTRSWCGPPTRVAVTVRCVRGIDSRGLHVTNLAALRRSLERVARPGRDLPGRRLRASGLRGRASAGDRRRCAQRRDRGRLGDRQGDQGPLHAPASTPTTPRSGSPTTSATRPRTIAQAILARRPVGASPPLVPVDRLLAARARPSRHLRTRPRGTSSGRPSHRRRCVTPTTSKRTPPRGDRAAGRPATPPPASAASPACGGRPPAPGASGPGEVARRRSAFTSTKTSTPRSSATMSISPRTAPARSRCAPATLIAPPAQAGGDESPRPPAEALAGHGHLDQARRRPLPRWLRRSWRAVRRIRHDRRAPRVRGRRLASAGCSPPPAPSPCSGVEARAGPRRGRRPPRAALVLARRPARRGGARVARAGAGGPRQLRLQVPPAADHGEPGAGGPSQGGTRLRSGDRRRPARPPRSSSSAGSPARAGARRGAGPRRVDPLGARGARDGRARPPLRPERGSRSRSANAEEAALANLAGHGGAVAEGGVGACSGWRTWASSPRSAPTTSRRRRPRRGCRSPRLPGRCPTSPISGPAVPATRPRGRRRGRAQPADRRPARGRQVDGRPAAARRSCPRWRRRRRSR